MRKFVPKLPAYFDRVTLDHLLPHTAGVRDYIALLMLGGINVEDHSTDEDALSAIARQAKLDFAPGSEHNYSNSGYFLLSLVVKKASGKSLRQFALERIFTPLGMSHTRILDDHTLVIPHRAASYEAGAGGAWRLSTSAWEQTGDGAVQSTVGDLAKWDANFYRPKIGGARLVEQLQQVGVLSDGEKLTYARGLTVNDYRGLRVLAHGGAWMGFRAEMLRFPETGIGAAALCNVGSAAPSVLLAKVADIVLADRLTTAPPAPSETNASDTPKVAATFKPDDYTGTYFGAEQALLRRIEAREGKLWHVRPQGSDSELAFEGEHRFRMLGVPTPATVQFVSEGAGARRLTLVSGGESFEMKQVAPYAPDTDALAAFVGNYESAELETRWRLIANGAELRLQPRRGPALPLTPAFADAFTGSGTLIRFQRDDTHRIAGFAVGVGRARGIQFRRIAAPAN